MLEFQNLSLFVLFIFSIGKSILGDSILTRTRTIVPVRLPIQSTYSLDISETVPTSGLVDITQ